MFFKYPICKTIRLTGPSDCAQRKTIQNIIVPVGGGTDGKASAFVKKGIMFVINLFALYCDKSVWVTILLNLILIVETERSQGEIRAAPWRSRICSAQG